MQRDSEPISLPKTFYKYLPKQYAKELVEQGVIKIGTLYSYRSKYEGDTQRSDPEEGITKHKPKNVTQNQDGTYNVSVRIRPMFQGSIMMSQNSYELSSANAYMYCFSSKKSKELMDNFEDCDTCVAIKDIKKFFELVSYKLAKIGFIAVGDPRDVGPCQYTSREMDESHELKNIPECFIKDVKYKNQDEWRLLWFSREKSGSTVNEIMVPISKDIEDPEPFACKELIDLCEIVTF